MATDPQKVDMFLMANSKYFESHRIISIRERLLNLDDARFQQLHAIHLKDPTLILIVSLVGGTFGVDRFLVGDVGLGVAKLLTCGGLGIWTIIDWFLIMGRTKEVNLQTLELYMGSNGAMTRTTMG